MRLDDLVSTLRDSASLQRVQAIEAIDASTAVMADTVNSILLDALDDRDPLIGDAALRALVVRDDEQVLQVSQRHLARNLGETSELARVRLAVRNEDVSALRQLMLNGDVLVQQHAFEALASNDPAAAVELLKKEFQDRASLYRLQTLELLARSAYTNSSATLMSILELTRKDADPLVRDRGEQLFALKRAESAQTE